MGRTAAVVEKLEFTDLKARCALAHVGEQDGSRDEAP